MPRLRDDQCTIVVSMVDPTITNPPNILASLAVTSWKSVDGADLSSGAVKTRPGGMGFEVQLGGPKTRSDATCETHYTAFEANSVNAYLAMMETYVGWGVVTISTKPLDVNEGSAAGGGTGSARMTPTTHSVTGVLKEVKKPKWDVEGNNAALISIVVSTNVGDGGHLVAS